MKQRGFVKALFGASAGGFAVAKKDQAPTVRELVQEEEEKRELKFATDKMHEPVIGVSSNAVFPGTGMVFNHPPIGGWVYTERHLKEG